MLYGNMLDDVQQSLYKRLKSTNNTDMKLLANN